MSRRAAALHADWLTLVEPNGPFLTLPVLRRVWPHGLDRLDSDLRSQVRQRLAALDPEDPASCTAWIEWVLRELLGYGPRLLVGPRLPDTLVHTVPEHGVVLRPDYALVEPADPVSVHHDTHPRA